MNDKTPAALAQYLVSARRHGAAVSAQGWEGTLHDAEQAYAVQREVGVALGWFGAGVPMF